MAIPAEPFARVIGRVIAQIDAEAGKKGMVIPFADLLIGGTALYSGYGLVTRNEPHFRMIPKLNVLPFKERPVQSICAAAGVPVHVTKVQPIDVRKIRTRMELSQSEFARKFGFSIDARPELGARQACAGTIGEDIGQTALSAPGSGAELSRLHLRKRCLSFLRGILPP